MTKQTRYKRDYFAILAEIIEQCPNSVTNLHWRTGLNYTTFIGPSYLKLLCKQDLLKPVIGQAERFGHQKNTIIYIPTPKGERYLELMKEAKKLLGIGD